MASWSSSSSYLVGGPPVKLKSEKITFAELLYNRLKRKEQSHVLLVEEQTGEEISCGALLKDVVTLALILQELGIFENDTVGIITPNTWKFAVPLLSALLIGATISPINAASSKDDFRNYLSLSKSKILFVSKNVLDIILDLKTELTFINHIIVLDKNVGGELYLGELLSRKVNFEMFRIFKKNTDALIMYSSGTTGFPKALVLTQENLLNCVTYLWDSDYISIEENSITLGILPLHHLFGLLLLYGFIGNGNKMIFTPKFEPNRFLNAIQKYKITHLVTVPPLLLFLAKSSLVDHYDLSSVIHIICGAAPLGKEVENIASQRFQTPIRQLYGLSECGAISIMPPHIRKLGSVGKIVPGALAKTIDPKTKEILGANVNGEICFKSLGVMKGYKNNEEETRKMIDEDGYLHTGDVGYFDEDGFLFILDRMKDFIKYKGFQVPPAQLEDILKKHPDVKNAAVLGKPDEKSGELATAFIVRQTNATITEDEIIKYIAERVSIEKQLHGGVIFRDEIPQSSSGKILKKELRKLLF